MNERYLIINADDFGLCESMNQAVQELFRLGAITSSSILSPAPRAAKASALAAQQKLPAGVHWTLFPSGRRSFGLPHPYRESTVFLRTTGFCLRTEALRQSARLPAILQESWKRNICAWLLQDAFLIMRTAMAEPCMGLMEGFFS